MKKLILVVLALCLMSSLAIASELSIGDNIKKIPALKQGIGYSLKNSNTEYLSTIEVMAFKGVSLEAGYTSQDKAIAVLSYKIANLKDLGFNVPILDLMYLQPGVFYGFGGINRKDLGDSESTYGLSLTMLDIKF